MKQEFFWKQIFAILFDLPTFARLYADTALKRGPVPDSHILNKNNL